MKNKGWLFGQGEYELPPDYPVDVLVNVLEAGVKALDDNVNLYPANSPGAAINMAAMMTAAAVQAHDEVARGVMNRPANLSEKDEQLLVNTLNYHASVARMRLKEAMIMCARAIVSLDKALGDPDDVVPTS